MKKQQENTGSHTITLEKKVVAHHLTGGSELIPTKVQANIRQNISQLLDIDDKGIVTNYAILPDPW